MTQIISSETLRTLADAWIADSAIVAGPTAGPKGHIFFQKVAQAEDLLLDAAADPDRDVYPTNSIKEFFFPKHEKLYSYRQVGKEVELEDAPPFETKQLILGARPCDTASLPILDHVFNWDFKDAFYNRRRELTTIVTFACQGADSNCFCTSVGLAPDSEQGTDAILFDLGDGTFEVRTVTEKGEALFTGKTEESDKVGQAGPGPDVEYDLEAVNQFLLENFDSDKWAEWSLRCLGCGGCSFVCPTCHCFDIVDETTHDGGTRVKNWDTCQFSLFTLHASGHNPRDVQSQRQRQRMNHKFNIYPDKFGEILCTGCGNCGRACPGSLGVRRVLETVENEAKQKTE
jgi:ferredoxin